MNSFVPFEWIAAIRFLREGRSQTLLTIIGASVGVAVIVFMSALLTGVQSNIFNRVLSTQANIVISPLEDVARPLHDDSQFLELAVIQKPTQRLRSIDQWQILTMRLASRKDVVAVSPAAAGAAFAVRGDAAKAISLTGVEPKEFFRIINIPEKIIHGSARLAPGDVLIGKELSTDLGVGIGEKLRVRTGTGTDETYVISGVFDLGNKETNERNVFVPLRAAQSLLGLPGGITSLSINLLDPYQSEVVAAELRTGLGVNAESWIKIFDQLFTALRAQTIANVSIRFFVGLAVALGIASVLVVSVVQRSHEIGILRAMGAARGQVLRVFLVQGALVGFAGSIFGSLAGAGFVVVWRIFARNPDGTEFFPIALPPSLFITTMITATLIGLFAAILPAISAARLNPVDAIRG
jgi:lipoprotein-releasing system permease protein